MKCGESSSNFDNFRNPDEVKLIEEVVSGKKKAIEQLFEEYKEIILKISERILILTGNRGLLKAAKRFYDTNGINFSAYGVWWI